MASSANVATWHAVLHSGEREMLLARHVPRVLYYSLDDISRYRMAKPPWFWNSTVLIAAVSCIGLVVSMEW